MIAEKLFFFLIWLWLIALLVVGTALNAHLYRLYDFELEDDLEYIRKEVKR